MSSPKLVTRQAFGTQGTNKNCLVFYDDHHLMYVCGNSVVVYNTESREQSFISASHKAVGITSISASHLKKTIAISENVSDHGIVSLFDSHAPYKKKKSINCKDLGSNIVVATSFSYDGKYFIVQGGAPEWNLCYWNIEKVPKLLYTYKVCSHEDQSVSSISFCPDDHTIIAVFGKGVGRLLKFQEGHLKQLGMSLRRDYANFTSHAWLSNDRCIVGTEGGEVLLIENLDFKFVIFFLILFILFF